MKPTFFQTPAEWREWLAQHHDRQKELLVGFYKTGSGTPSITWPESVDAALCFGWIDGVRRRIDDVSYSIRFTPRRPRSIWSAVNMKRVAVMIENGLLHPAGRKAFELREEKRSAVYSFEQENIAFARPQEQRFRMNRAAWKFFQSQPAWYRRAATWWVINAKREETREKRLAVLIDDSESNRTVKNLTRPVAGSKGSELP
jgi:uncharacterized protein YdeI (YjbR/CyaY-like superfamily)